MRWGVAREVLPSREGPSWFLLVSLMSRRTFSRLHMEACCLPPPVPWAKGALVEWVGAETEGTGTEAVESIRAACWVTSGKSFGLS